MFLKPRLPNGDGRLECAQRLLHLGGGVEELEQAVESAGDEPPCSALAVFPPGAPVQAERPGAPVGKEEADGERGLSDVPQAEVAAIVRAAQKIRVGRAPTKLD